MPFKLVGTVLSALLAIVLGLPLLTGAAATPTGCGTDDPSIERALLTTRTIESGGRYDLPPGPGGASGAYQYLGSTWRRWATEIGVDINRYPEAHLAPPEVQDAVAVANIRAVLGDTNDLARIPVAWYWPRALTHPEDLDIVPAPQAGNTMTVRAYRDRWLRTFTGETSGDTCDPVGEYALPVDRALIDPNPSMLARAHHDYPAIDLPVRAGTPVHAVAAGTVESVSLAAGVCGTGGCSEPCGIGVTILALDGSRWVYCHGSALHVTMGQTVTSGQLILTSGTSGRSTGPHLHLGVTVGGQPRCPQPLLTALYQRRDPEDPARLPTVGCTTR